MIDSDRLHELAEELLGAVRLRDEADPDAPRWEAEAHARRLERMIGELLLNGDAHADRHAAHRLESGQTN